MDRNISTFAREGDGDGLSDATIGARHQRRLPREFHPSSLLISLIRSVRIQPHAREPRCSLRRCGVAVACLACLARSSRCTKLFQQTADGVVIASLRHVYIGGAGRVMALVRGHAPKHNHAHLLQGGDGT
jgi:hypothetical protein